MVLVGHSMGGLIAKLQITRSGDHLWRSIANRPFDQVVMDDERRIELATAFFFEPSECVSSVIFMATPHRGSNYARRLIGRVGSSLVRTTEAQRQEHDKLVRCNPGVFKQEVRKRIPTSIDLLDPDSSLLKAINELPINRARLSALGHRQSLQNALSRPIRWCRAGLQRSGATRRERKDRRCETFRSQRTP